jgi:hypothetical protein
MKKFNYYGIEVRQTPDSKPFYLIQSKAPEILEWSDVPRKQENFLAGYQRQLDDRHTTITDYFTQPDNAGRNIIPSSVIIAVNKANITLTPDGDKGLFRIEINVDDSTEEDLLKSTLLKLKARLGPEELESINYEDPNVEDVEGDSESEDVPPESYLAVIVKKLEAAQANIGNLDPELRTAVKDYLSGVAKPGLILDGQHRVFGAKNVSAFSVSLPVVLIPDLDFSEQVFHFYVLNNKAKPLNKTELRSIIATSLSKKEIEDLYDRFKQVGVTAEETSWTYQMNTDRNSPFVGLVNFGFGNGTTAPIPENVAYQVVSKFIKLGKKYRMLYNDVAEWGSDLQTGAQHRLQLFFALWSAVKKQYPNAWMKAITNGKGQILQKVNLIVLQDFLLDKLVAEMPKRKAKSEKSPFADAALLEEEVGFQLVFLHEEFYLKEWKMKGLDTATGHKAFREAVDEAVNAQSQNLGSRKLFKASTT